MGILDLIFPIKCVGCGRAGKYFCETCSGDLVCAAQRCPMCARPAIGGVTHYRCRRPLGLDGVFALWKYEGVVRSGILALKYKFVYDMAVELGDLYCSGVVERFGIKGEGVLVPIPLHVHRRNWRGFNQTELLGKSVAEKYSWSYEPGVLKRHGRRGSQSGLDRAGRMKNVRGVFRLNGDVDRASTYVLFDDVWTTGSTMREACKVLKRGGVQIVWGMTLCR